MTDAMLLAAKAQLAEDGWCAIPGVLGADQAGHVLARLWAAAEESERRGVPTHMPALDPNASNVRVFHLLELDPIFSELIQHPTAVAVVRSLLGRDFLISNLTATIARPGSLSMALHSDQSLVVPSPWLQPWAVNIIWCVSDVSFENGATLFIPGSHHWQVPADVPRDAERLLRPFEAKAGSILAMDGRIWHTSGANITQDQDRALLFGYYTKPFLRPQVNWNVCLSPQNQASMNPQMRQWLGLDVTANIGRADDLRHRRAQSGRQEENP
jgi:ectoine hydroxylase-related dioxygenase (phytanoyl-CoA dioxygenase family)